MKTLKLFEDYTNSPTNRIHTLLKNMIGMFQETFDGKNDVFSTEELESLYLVEIESSLEKDPFEKNLLMNFSDGVYYYQVIFIIKVDDVVGDEAIEKAYLKIKIYDNDDGTILREWQSNVDLEVCTDDEQNEEGRFFVKVKTEDSELDYIESFIISKISEIREQFDQKQIE